MDFEKKLGRLEEIVKKMEQGELALEDSLKLFEEGVKLSRDCHKQLNEAELKVKKLIDVDDQGKMTTEKFDTNQE